MKRTTRLIYLCTFFLLAQTASADSYWGVKASSVDASPSDYSASTNAGIFAGVDIAQIGSNPVAFEGEFSETLIKGKVSGLNWNVQTLGLYAAMRTGEDNYFKFKAGYLSSTLKTSASSTTDFSGLSYGIGFGFSNYELEYTVTNGKSDNKLTMTSIAYLF